MAQPPSKPTAPRPPRPSSRQNRVDAIHEENVAFNKEQGRLAGELRRWEAGLPYYSAGKSNRIIEENSERLTPIWDSIQQEAHDLSSRNLSQQAMVIRECGLQIMKAAINLDAAIIRSGIEGVQGGKDIQECKTAVTIVLNMLTGALGQVDSITPLPEVLPNQQQVVDMYMWARQTALVKATNQVYESEALNPGVLSKAVKSGLIKSNSKFGRASRVNVDSFLIWVQKKFKLENREVKQVRNAIIGEIGDAQQVA